MFFFFKQKTAYEMRISDWSSDVCSSDLRGCRSATQGCGRCGPEGKMVPFSAFASGYWTFGSPKLERYNGLPAVQILGQAAPGFSSGDAMATVERLAQQLPPGVGQIGRASCRKECGSTCISRWLPAT